MGVVRQELGVLITMYAIEFWICWRLVFTLCLKKVPPTTNDNFNNSCRIPIIVGTNIAE